MEIINERFILKVENTALERAPKNIEDLMPYLVRLYRGSKEQVHAYFDELSEQGINKLVAKVTHYSMYGTAVQQNQAKRLLVIIEEYLKQY